MFTKIIRYRYVKTKQMVCLHFKQSHKYVAKSGH